MDTQTLTAKRLVVTVQQIIPFGAHSRLFQWFAKTQCNIRSLLTTIILIV